MTVEEVLKLPLQEVLDNYLITDMAGLGFEVEGIKCKVVPSYYEYHFIPEDVEFEYGKTYTADKALYIWGDGFMTEDPYLVFGVDKFGDRFIPSDITLADYVEYVNEVIESHYASWSYNGSNGNDDWMGDCQENVQKILEVSHE